MSVLLSEQPAEEIGSYPGVVIDAAAEREFAAFQQVLMELQAAAQSPNAARERKIAPPDDPFLARWSITFSGEVNLRRVGAFRTLIAKWEQTIDARIDEIEAGAVRLRLVTEPSVRPHFVDRMVRACRDRVGTLGQIAIRSQ